MSELKFYPNGDLIQKNRIEDEEWYSDYQTFSEMFLNEKVSIRDMIDLFQIDYKNIHEKEYPRKAQLTRWAIYLYRQNIKLNGK